MLSSAARDRDRAHVSGFVAEVLAADNEPRRRSLGHGKPRAGWVARVADHKGFSHRAVQSLAKEA